MTAAAAIRTPLRAATYQTLIGLLAVTGMRAGEAIRLDQPDIDLPAGLVTVRESKFGKSRQLPLHATTAAALAGYAALRDRHHPRPSSPAFLLSLAGTRLIYKNVHCIFHAHPGRGPGPALAPVPAPHPRPACWAGTTTAATPQRGCRCCRPGSATPTPAAPTGT
jgi:integrase